MHNTHKLCIHFSDFKTCRIFSMHAKALLIALTLSFAHLIGFWLRSAIHQHKLDFPCCFCSNTAAAAACSFSLCFYSFSKLESAFACLNKAEFHPFTSMTWTSSFKFYLVYCLGYITSNFALLVTDIRLLGSSVWCWPESKRKFGNAFKPFFLM